VFHSTEQRQRLGAPEKTEKKGESGHVGLSVTAQRGIIHHCITSKRKTKTKKRNECIAHASTETARKQSPQHKKL
jgi:hypothetical protein